MMGSNLPNIEACVFDAYPEAKETLTRLKADGKRLAILSNGSPRMLQAAVDNACITDLLDEIYSVESVGIYKPHPSVYEMPGEPDAMISTLADLPPIVASA